MACYHPRLVKEYYLGTQTGDVVCTACGESFASKEAAALDAARQGRAELDGEVKKMGAEGETSGTDNG